MKKLIAMGVVAMSVCVFAEEEVALTELLSVAKTVVAKDADADTSVTDSGLAAINRQIQELTEKINGAKSSSEEVAGELKRKLEVLKAQVKAKLEELKKNAEEKSEADKQASEARKAKIAEAKSSVSNLVNSVKNLIKE